MKVILKETIESLGVIGTEVAVADGYARNYLLPQKKAVLATAENRKLLARDRKKLELQIIKERHIAEEMAGRIEGVAVTIGARVSEENKLYGSVTARDIIAALAAKGVEVEKKTLLLKEPIKTLGDHKVPIRIYRDIEPEITVTVVAQ